MWCTPNVGDDQPKRDEPYPRYAGLWVVYASGVYGLFHLTFQSSAKAPDVERRATTRVKQRA